MEKEKNEMNGKVNNKNSSKASKRNTILLAILIVMVASVGAYAWFSVSNRARVENLTLIADHQGNLMIADDTGNGPGTYSDVLNIATATGASDIANTILSPVTTNDGKSFYSPNFNPLGKSVDSVTAITDTTELKKYYVYEKTFYLKAGIENPGSVTINRTYDIALYGVSTGDRTNGSYIIQNGSTNGNSAANAIRVSFTVEDLANKPTYIYEPNYDASNSGDSAQDNVKGQYGTYNTVKQTASGSFPNGTRTNESEKLFTMEENKDYKITMRIWIEGTDKDCTNAIAADTLAGQIMFISTEQKN